MDRLWLSICYFSLRHNVDWGCEDNTEVNRVSLVFGLWSWSSSSLFRNFLFSKLCTYVFAKLWKLSRILYREYMLSKLWECINLSKTWFLNLSRTWFSRSFVIYREHVYRENRVMCSRKPLVFSKTVHVENLLYKRFWFFWRLLPRFRWVLTSLPTLYIDQYSRMVQKVTKTMSSTKNC